eukprot:GHVU01133819.1.p1 GENE.GHVU01133819.1~~GHVU01133819.1.p1  ORF type:complete len:284 (-),score=86.06 GHVU01133819.1:137-988(-)
MPEEVDWQCNGLNGGGSAAALGGSRGTSSPDVPTVGVLLSSIRRDFGIGVRQMPEVELQLTLSEGSWVLRADVNRLAARAHGLGMRGADREGQPGAPGAAPNGSNAATNKKRDLNTEELRRLAMHIHSRNFSRLKLIDEFARSHPQLTKRDVDTAFRKLTTREKRDGDSRAHTYVTVEAAADLCIESELGAIHVQRKQEAAEAATAAAAAAAAAAASSSSASTPTGTAPPPPPPRAAAAAAVGSTPPPTGRSDAALAMQGVGAAGRDVNGGDAADADMSTRPP